MISSMATRHLLVALAQAHAAAATSTAATQLESVGGVDAARRVMEGERFDAVVLASDAIERLMAAGRIAPGSVRSIADSVVAIAVRAGAHRPDVSTAAALRATLLQASAIGYSTGPSGTELVRLFERWGVIDALKDRLLQARPGIPVGDLVASGEAEIGFQQLSELMDVSGIELLGVMPAGAEIVSRFCGGVVAGSPCAEAAQSLLDFMASPKTAPLKLQHGMRSVD